MEFCWRYFSRCSIVALAIFSAVYLFANRKHLNYKALNDIASDRKAINEKSPQDHIFYLKNHKTASTTVYCILAEYCRSHQLLPLLPADLHINQRPPFHSSQILTYPDVMKYDMLFSHHIYSDEILTYLHNDTFKFTTLRKPLNQFVSSFIYFRKNNFEYLSNITSSNPLQTFLENPTKYEAKGYHSYTNNRQSMDLGYNLSHRFDDMQYIQTFIAQTEKRFDLVLITDYFDESLIILKRRLRWSTMDIVYFKKLENPETLQALKQLTRLQKLQHERFSTADVTLHQYFFNKFLKIMTAEVGLKEEVNEFQFILRQVQTFCGKKQNFGGQLKIAAGAWTSEIILSFSKCKWLSLDEISFTKYLKKLHTTH